MLLCPVRDCHLPLVREERCVVCPQGHSFDVARSGYINLLQPQDRKSKQPGDTAAALQGRRRLHDSGMTEPLLRAMALMVAPTPDDVVLDAGCGDGFYLGTLAKEIGFQAHGLDISIPAVDAAAKRYPSRQWIVANADRFVPYADKSFSLVMSITARMNSAEFRRVLGPAGALVVGIFVGEEVAAFDHKVVTDYRWPVDEFSDRLARTGFKEVERLQRPSEGPHRPHAAIAAIATDG